MVNTQLRYTKSILLYVEFHPGFNSQPLYPHRPAISIFFKVVFPEREADKYRAEYFMRANSALDLTDAACITKHKLFHFIYKCPQAHPISLEVSVPICDQAMVSS
jgi:hypothetical protein